MRVSACAAAMIFALSGCGDPAPMTGAPKAEVAPVVVPQDLTPRSGLTAASTEVTDGRVSLKAGDRTRIRKRAGTFKPADTGHTAEVNIPAGKTGLVLGGTGQLALVRWDAQSWEEWPSGAPVSLKEFEATVHIDYLDASSP